MDENKEVNSTDPKREKVRVIPLSAIDDAPDHPFGVRDDEEMAELVESISTFGVINPVTQPEGITGGYLFSFNLLNVLVVLTVSTALCLVGTSVAWILKGVAFALILLYASVEDFTKREADKRYGKGLN